MIRFDTKKDMEHYDNLYHQIYEKDKEIERLNNIIDELEKWLNEEKSIMLGEIGAHVNIEIDNILNKMKELEDE